MTCFKVLLVLLYTYTVHGNTQCNSKLDMAFLVDSSRSMSLHDQDAALTFVDGLAQHFNVSPTETRVSVVQFAHRTLRLCCFTDDLSNLAVSQCVEDQRELHGSTRTDVALRYERSDIFTEACGAREAAVQVLLLLSDGRPDHPERTMTTANALKNQGVKIVSVTIGNGKEEGQSMKTLASDGLAFQADNPTDVMETVYDALCQLA